MVQDALVEMGSGRSGFSLHRERRQSCLPGQLRPGRKSARPSFFSPSTEGEDKPLKYPTIFNTADIAIITKMDLAAAVEFDLAAARRSIEAVRPGMKVLEVSAKSGQGMEQWRKLLVAQLPHQSISPLTKGDAFLSENQ